MNLKTIFGERQTFDWKVTVVTISSTLLLLVDFYHQLTPIKGLDRLILYLAIPLLIVVTVFRERPAEYGFSIGDWRAGLLLVAGGAIFVGPILWLTAHGSALKGYYQSELAGLPWNTFLDLFGWEFFFRGFILFAYTRHFGAAGLWLQAVPFALAHAGKPEVEALSTIFGGFVFGWIAYRTRSFLYPFLLHWFVASLTIVVAAGLLG